MNYTIEKWTPNHPQWPQLVAFAQEHDLFANIIDSPALIAESHYFTALHNKQIIAFIMCLVQPIGPEMDVPELVDQHGRMLTEAKIRAFFVEERFRNQGIGTALQKCILDLAPQLGCFQVRSRSELSKKANYAIKLKLGFAAHPAIRKMRSGDSPGVYWVKNVQRVDSSLQSTAND